MVALPVGLSRCLPNVEVLRPLYERIAFSGIPYADCIEQERSLERTVRNSALVLAGGAVVALAASSMLARRHNQVLSQHIKNNL